MHYYQSPFRSDTLILNFDDVKRLRRGERCQIGSLLVVCEEEAPPVKIATPAVLPKGGKRAVEKIRKAVRAALAENPLPKPQWHDKVKQAGRRGTCPSKS
jgi:hypothetical protein